MAHLPASIPHCTRRAVDDSKETSQFVVGVGYGNRPLDGDAAKPKENYYVHRAVARAGRTAYL
jgi:hypothetical protein